MLHDENNNQLATTYLRFVLHDENNNQLATTYLRLVLHDENNNQLFALGSTAINKHNDTPFCLCVCVLVYLDRLIAALTYEQGIVERNVREATVNSCELNNNISKVFV